MSTNELDALARQIGQAPVTVSTSNRNAVRKFLRTAGVASALVEKMTTRELGEAYNVPSKLAALVEDSANVAPPRPRREAGPEMAEVIAKAITVALSTLPSSLDESRVIELIQEHAPERAPTVIEVRDRDGVIGRIEGHTHQQLPDVLSILSAGVNVWMAGPAGSGKSTIAKQCAEALGLAFYATGAVQNEYKLTGFIDAEGRTVRTAFREAFEHGGVFLWDEIDASSANALTAFNQALANDVFPFPDGMVAKHPDFIAIAAANTFGTGATAEYVGRNRIDAATLDRFAMIFLEYDLALETAMGERYHANGAEWAKIVQKYRAAVAVLGLRHLISPRATEFGARMMASGARTSLIYATVLRKGLDQATWDKLEAYA